MHTYGNFYVGMSELSTIVLCFALAFHREIGVAALPDAYPTLEFIIGASFAISFFLCRICAWLFVSYHLARDLVSMWMHHYESIHSLPAYVFVVIALGGMTLLQIYWLTTIYEQVMNALGPKGGEGKKKK